MFALDALSQLAFRIDDPRERAAVLRALEGPGKPAGVERVNEDAETVSVWFDAHRTAPALITLLVDIERRRFALPAGPRAGDLGDAELARLVAEATVDPELDENRILEHLVPELDA